MLVNLIEEIKMIEIIPNLHPVFVHFTVTLFVITGLLQLIPWLFKEKVQNNVFIFIQKWLVILGSLAVLVTVVTGVQAYYSVSHDTPSHLAMTDHRNWALITAVIFLLGAALFYFMPKLRQSVAGSCFFVAFLLVTVTAFKGGELVYRHGLGVMALPQVTGEGHDHDHADGGHDHGTTENVSAEPVVQGHQESSHEHSSHEHSSDKTSDHHQTSTSPLFNGLDSEAAKAVIAFHTAINSGNAEQARRLLDDAVIIFEGGGVERSADQYANHHMKSDMAFLNKMNITSEEHQVKIIGEMAISMSRSQIKGNYKDKVIDISSMETMVLRKNNNGWKIIHIHWSN